MCYHDILADQVIPLSDELSVVPIALNHPGGSLGYKLISPKGSVCYITDHEHKIGEINQPLIDFTHKSKLTIYDSTYDDDTFAPKLGWGHSTWQEALRLQKAAQIEQMAIFHHDPSSTDTHLNALSEKISKDTQAFVAKQGQVLLF